MRQRIFGFVALASGVLLAAAPAVAHHSFAAEFDANKPVELKGFVTKIEWQNPHVWFYVNVPAEDGTIENWGFEMGPPHLLQARGWNRNTMKIGDEVVIEGSLAKNGSKRVNARTVVMASTGQQLGAGSSQGNTLGGQF